MNKTIKILTMNIGNPSVERAKKQIDWIRNRDEDIFFLTETKNSGGCNLIADSFSCDQTTFDSKATCLNVSFPRSVTGDYGVMCLSRPEIVKAYSPFTKDDQYHCRHLENDITINEKIFHTVCLYVPSRDQSYEKIVRKKNFLERSLNYIQNIDCASTIICGDFNILERNHIPHYRVFKEWEYRFYDDLVGLGFVDVYKHCRPQENEHSWVGRTGDGYRYDYCFVSKDLSHRIVDCKFLHETRNNKLTDHSALRIEILID